jgi:hypothetical protein
MVRLGGSPIGKPPQCRVSGADFRYLSHLIRPGPGFDVRGEACAAGAVAASVAATPAARKVLRLAELQWSVDIVDSLVTGRRGRTGRQQSGPICLGYQGNVRAGCFLGITVT